MSHLELQVRAGAYFLIEENMRREQPIFEHPGASGLRVVIVKSTRTLQMTRSVPEVERSSFKSFPCVEKYRGGAGCSIQLSAVQKFEATPHSSGFKDIWTLGLEWSFLFDLLELISGVWNILKLRILRPS